MVYLFSFDVQQTVSGRAVRIAPPYSMVAVKCMGENASPPVFMAAAAVYRQLVTAFTLYLKHNVRINAQQPVALTAAQSVFILTDVFKALTDTINNKQI